MVRNEDGFLLTTVSCLLSYEPFPETHLAPLAAGGPGAVGRGRERRAVGAARGRARSPQRGAAAAARRARAAELRRAERVGRGGAGRRALRASDERGARAAQTLVGRAARGRDPHVHPDA